MAKMKRSVPPSVAEKRNTLETVDPPFVRPRTVIAETTGYLDTQRGRYHKERLTVNLTAAALIDEQTPVEVVVEWEGDGPPPDFQIGVNYSQIPIFSLGEPEVTELDQTRQRAIWHMTGQLVGGLTLTGHAKEPWFRVDLQWKFTDRDLRLIRVAIEVP